MHTISHGDPIRDQYISHIHILLVSVVLIACSCSAINKVHFANDNTDADYALRYIDPQILKVDTMLGGPDLTKLWFGIYFADHSAEDSFLVLFIGFNEPITEAMVYYKHNAYVSDVAAYCDCGTVLRKDLRQLISSMSIDETIPFEYRDICIALDEWVSNGSIDLDRIYNALIAARSFYYKMHFGQDTTNTSIVIPD